MECPECREEIRRKGSIYSNDQSLFDVTMQGEVTDAYDTKGKRGACKDMTDLIAAYHTGRLFSFLNFPAYGKELVRIKKAGLTIDYARSLGVEWNKGNGRRYEGILRRLKEMKIDMPMHKGDFDDLVMKWNDHTFDVIHADYNGPFNLPKRKQAIAHLWNISKKGTLLFITVNQRVRGKCRSCIESDLPAKPKLVVNYSGREGSGSHMVMYGLIK